MNAPMTKESIIADINATSAKCAAMLGTIEQDHLEDVFVVEMESFIYIDYCEAKRSVKACGILQASWMDYEEARYVAAMVRNGNLKAGRAVRLSDALRTTVANYATLVHNLTH